MCVFKIFNIQVLQSTLKWLDDWEQRVVDKLIKPEHFLTSNTAEGLRITLTSSIQICCYLKEKYNMNYVLTGKINQDSAEVRIPLRENRSESKIFNCYNLYF